MFSCYSFLFFEWFKRNFFRLSEKLGLKVYLILGMPEKRIVMLKSHWNQLGVKDSFKNEVT